MVTPLIDAMGVGLTGEDPAPGPALSIVDNLEILVDQFGSGRAAARALGVAESTLRGWRKGVRPRLSAPTIAAMARGAASYGRYQRAYDRPNFLKIRAWVTQSSDTRLRTIHVGREIPAAKIRTVLTLWSKLDDEKADRMLWRAITKHYSAFDSIGHIEWLSFERGKDDL